MVPCRSALGLIMMLYCCGATAQWGLHATVLTESSSSVQGHAVPTMAGIGYQHDTSPRTAWSLDVLLSTPVGDGNASRVLTIADGSGGQANYTANPVLAGLRYKSYAFLATNKEAAGYLAVSAGAMVHRLTCERRKLNNNDPADDVMPVRITSTKMVFPLCLHVGLRGDLRYVYLDWYAWCGYQVLGGRPMFDNDYSMIVTGMDGISGEARPPRSPSVWVSPLALAATGSIGRTCDRGVLAATKTKAWSLHSAPVPL
jgi:hypothetical protein